MLTKQARISYVMMAVLLLLISVLHLATLVLTALFGYFALRTLSFGRSKMLALTLYLVLLTAIGYGLFYFSRQAVVAFPAIAEKTILAVEEIKERFSNIGRYVRTVLFEIASLIIGLVVAASLFLNARWQVEGDPNAVSDSIYAQVSRELGLRFKTFYRSFATVIGAQLVISAINTTLTALFLAYNHFPHLPVLVIFTFLCGLLPIVGNLMSNTLIIGVGFTISPQMALFALVFLVVIHKLEYFLNSKIIGDRIKNPMWLTLLGLVLGEQWMGIPGMILAPVVLHYIKVEASRSKMSDFDNVPAFSPSKTTNENAVGEEGVLPNNGATP
jgi:predicted PurR-regulated permease PerM